MTGLFSALPASAVAHADRPCICHEMVAEGPRGPASSWHHRSFSQTESNGWRQLTVDSAMQQGRGDAAH